MSDIENDLEMHSEEEELKPISEAKVKTKRVISEAQKANLQKAREKRSENAKMKKEEKASVPKKTAAEKKFDNEKEKEESKVDYSSLDKFLNSNSGSSSDPLLLNLLKIIADDVKQTNKRVDKMYTEKKAKRQLKGEQPQVININNDTKPSNKNSSDANKSLKDLMMGNKFKH